MILKYVISLALIVIAFGLLSTDSGRYLAIRRILFLLLIFVSSFSILFEGWWTKLAQNLGLSSGPDLITYLVTFAFFGFVITNYRWKRKIEDKVVAIVREMSIKKID